MTDHSVLTICTLGFAAKQGERGQVSTWVASSSHWLQHAGWHFVAARLPVPTQHVCFRVWTV